jgi:tubulin--tyrosine ligase/tubulin polyglutamylase TTLL9
MVQNPLLIGGRLYEMRMWVMIDHNSKWYLFKEGYFRIASRSFQEAY